MADERPAAAAPRPPSAPRREHAAASALVCCGCGHRVPAGEPFPFRCPDAHAGDDVEHVLRRVLDPAAWGPAERARALFLDPEPHPFLRYRKLLHGYLAACERGLSDPDYRRVVERLDAAVARLDGRGFRVTPFAPSDELARRLGVGELTVKDETGNVTGTHKGRHLFGLMLWLELRAALGETSREDDDLAISSCGNAALAAAVVARAGGRRLRVFAPGDADPGLVERIEDLGGEVTLCRRQPGERGDPAYLRFRAALSGGAVPFTVQGPENGLVLDGAKTLAWEMVSTLLERGAVLDRLFVQVGGGALAAAIFRGLREAHALGVLPQLPRLHAVQTRAAPLVRAYERLAGGIDERLGGRRGQTGGGDVAARAERIAAAAGGRVVRREIRAAARHRSRFMWPWEEVPRSVAKSILDDETYDWLEVVEGMLASGGFPLAVSEERLLEARELGRDAGWERVGPTGTAGLAGALEISARGLLGGDEQLAVLFTGVERFFRPAEE